jgi:ribosomal protein L12E/L44/L45/RPP1/RPP2
MKALLSWVADRRWAGEEEEEEDEEEDEEEEDDDGRGSWSDQ